MNHEGAKALASDRECVLFLQWALPRLKLHWPGFRRVRRQVCKRLNKRISALGLQGYQEYRELLESNSAEWNVLDRCCKVTISRFYRDRSVFDQLITSIVPELAREAQQRPEKSLRIWSAGCASGEEPYTLSLIWDLLLKDRFPEVELQIVATEFDPELLQRARTACYPASSVRELPELWLSRAFRLENAQYCLYEQYRRAVDFICQDLRTCNPDGPFSLVLCRNLAFTYFDQPLRDEVLQRIAGIMERRGLLVLGVHEQLPQQQRQFVQIQEKLPLYRRSG